MCFSFLVFSSRFILRRSQSRNIRPRLRYLLSLTRSLKPLICVLCTSVTSHRRGRLYSGRGGCRRSGHTFPLSLPVDVTPPHPGSSLPAGTSRPAARSVSSEWPRHLCCCCFIGSAFVTSSALQLSWPLTSARSLAELLLPQ